MGGGRWAWGTARPYQSGFVTQEALCIPSERVTGLGGGAGAVGGFANRAQLELLMQISRPADIVHGAPQRTERGRRINDINCLVHVASTTVGPPAVTVAILVDLSALSWSMRCSGPSSVLGPGTGLQLYGHIATKARLAALAGHSISPGRTGAIYQVGGWRRATSQGWRRPA